MGKETKVAIIGLDTSHTIAFTKLIQGEPGKGIPELKVIKCLRFPSRFLSEADSSARQTQLEGWGVKVTLDFAEAVEGADAIFLELNDPATHLNYFEKVAGLGKPVFLDKPLAASLDEGRKILEIARKNKTQVWSASSLRFLKSLQRLCAEIPAEERKAAAVYGPLGKAPAGNSLVWYGVHTAEMLVTIMGQGAKSVFAREDEAGVVATVHYGNGRRGIIEVNNGYYSYGGHVITPKGAKQFTADGEELYVNLMDRIVDFLQNSTIPVPLEAALEVQAILEAMGNSIASGKEEKVALHND